MPERIYFTLPSYVPDVSNLVGVHMLAVRSPVHAYDKSPSQSRKKRIDDEGFFISNDEPVLFWDHQSAVEAPIP